MKTELVPLVLTLEATDVRIEISQADVTVGRHSRADVRLALPDVSRRHCRLIFENQQWHVIDLNSLNGVFVNGERMQEATLYSGDRLQLGKFCFQVEYRGGAAPIIQRIADAMKEQRWAS